MDAIKTPEPADTPCALCGRPKVEHWAVNFSDGPHVGGPVLICPRSVYVPEAEHE